MTFNENKIYHFEGKGRVGKVTFEDSPPLQGQYAIWTNGALCGLAGSKNGIARRWKQYSEKYGLTITRIEVQANKKN